jgi:hypothetical protein
MAGLVPAIHAIARSKVALRAHKPVKRCIFSSLPVPAQNGGGCFRHDRVDGREEPGHDGREATP